AKSRAALYQPPRSSPGQTSPPVADYRVAFHSSILWDTLHQEMCVNEEFPTFLAGEAHDSTPDLSRLRGSLSPAARHVSRRVAPRGTRSNPRRPAPSLRLSRGVRRLRGYLGRGRAGAAVRARSYRPQSLPGRPRLGPGRV